MQKRGSKKLFIILSVHNNKKLQFLFASSKTLHQLAFSNLLCNPMTFLFHYQGRKNPLNSSHVCSSFFELTKIVFIHFGFHFPSKMNKIRNKSIIHPNHHFFVLDKLTQHISQPFKYLFAQCLYK